MLLVEPHTTHLLTSAALYHHWSSFVCCYADCSWDSICKYTM